MKTLLFAFLLLPVILFSQPHTTKGIQWATGLSWEQIKQKAKAENKYILIDAYATWCGPCHLMDNEVYPDEQVGKAINDKFISVKVQMDKTNYDNEQVKKWYTDARLIESNYTVTAFPTFLFFHPDGTPMHRAVGYRNPMEFIILAKDAVDPQKQYYALLKNYQPGKIDTSELKGLARALRNLGGDLAAKMAIEYLTRIPKTELSKNDNLILMMQFGNNQEIQNIATKYISTLSPKVYSQKDHLSLFQTFNRVPSVSNLILQRLNGFSKKELSKHLILLRVFEKDPMAKAIADKYIYGLKSEIYKRENIEFIVTFTKSSKDRGFKIFRDNAGRIDNVFKVKDYAITVIGNVIIDEEYDSFFQDAIKNKTDNVPWQAIAQTVKEKYGTDISERVELQVRSALYRYFTEKTNKYWPEYIKYNSEMLERYGTDTTNAFQDATLINNFVFDAIFYHSDDAEQMNKALKWMEGVLRRNPQHANNIDTYANLLYKMQRKEEAIQWQKKAVEIASTDKEQEYLLPSLKGNLSKMQNGEPTWKK